MSAATLLEERASFVPTVMVDLALVDPSPYQARRKFNDFDLASQAETIRTHGLSHPVLLRRKGLRFELISGERRVRSVRDFLHWSQIEAKVIECTDQEASDLCAAANFQTKTLLPSEQARQVKLMESNGRSNVFIADFLGLTPTNVADLLLLADMPPTVQEMVDDKNLAMNKLPIIQNIQGAIKQVQAATIAVTGKLNATELKARTQHYPKKPCSVPAVRQPPASAYSANVTVAPTLPLPLPELVARSISMEELIERLIDLQIDVQDFKFPQNQSLSEGAHALANTVFTFIQALQLLQRNLPPPSGRRK